MLLWRGGITLRLETHYAAEKVGETKYALSNNIHSAVGNNTQSALSRNPHSAVQWVILSLSRRYLMARMQNCQHHQLHLQRAN